ncbi:hypothetical protein Tco_1101373, partial [Tanacetum coccineum]
RTIRQEFVVPQPRSPTHTHVADEAASTGVDVRYGGAATTVTGLEAGQGSCYIDKTLTMPQDSPLPRVNILRSDEGSLTLQELTGRNISEIDQDPTISLVQYDPTISVSTAKPISTAGAAVTTTSVDVSTATISTAKDKASSFNIEEWDDIQARVKADEELAQRYNQRKKGKKAKERRNKPPIQAQQRTYMSNYIKHMEAYTLQQLRSYSFEEIKNLFETTIKRVHTFVPLDSEIERANPESTAGSSKRDVEEELAQESSKRQKTRESLISAEEPKDKEEELRENVDATCSISLKVKSLVALDLGSTRFKGSYLLEELVTKMVIYHLFEVEVEFHSQFMQSKLSSDASCEALTQIPIKFTRLRNSSYSSLKGPTYILL